MTMPEPSPASMTGAALAVRADLDVVLPSFRGRAGWSRRARLLLLGGDDHPRRRCACDAIEGAPGRLLRGAVRSVVAVRADVVGAERWRWSRTKPAVMATHAVNRIAAMLVGHETLVDHEPCLCKPDAGTACRSKSRTSPRSCEAVRAEGRNIPQPRHQCSAGCATHPRRLLGTRMRAAACLVL